MQGLTQGTNIVFAWKKKLRATKNLSVQPAFGFKFAPATSNKNKGGAIHSTMT